MLYVSSDLILGLHLRLKSMSFNYVIFYLADFPILSKCPNHVIILELTF